MSHNEPQKCRVSAMNLLARRDHSTCELRQKLISRNFDAEIVEQVLVDLVQERLLSDDRFVESFVRAKISKGLGPLRLRQELREHDIDDALIDEFVRDQPWLELAAEVRQKRFGQLLPADFKDRAKQMRFLQYRGFSLEQINSAMKQDY